MSFSATLADILLPPASLPLLALLALRFSRRAKAAASAVLLILLLLSMPIVASLLQHSLTPGESAGTGAPEAIVILSAEVERVADPAQLEPGALTLERLRAGAALHRRTGLPVLVTGGVIGDTPIPVGKVMERSLTEDFRIPVRWTEAQSRDTWENAALSAPLLRAAGISRVYVVTHLWHMRRSLMAFRHAGLEPYPAPVREDAWPRGRWTEFVPRASAWLHSYWALHEWVGLAYYHVRR